MQAKIPITDLERIPLLCAWKGCGARCAPMPAPLPDGWVCLVTFRSLEKPGRLDFLRDRVHRDAVLCAKHSAALEGLLVKID